MNEIAEVRVPGHSGRVAGQIVEVLDVGGSQLRAQSQSTIQALSHKEVRGQLGLAQVQISEKFSTFQCIPADVAEVIASAKCEAVVQGILTLRALREEGEHHHQSGASDVEDLAPHEGAR